MYKSFYIFKSVHTLMYKRGSCSLAHTNYGCDRKIEFI